jgi:hypothetical protein
VERGEDGGRGDERRGGREEKTKERCVYNETTTEESGV